MTIRDRRYDQTKKIRYTHAKNYVATIIYNIYPFIPFLLPMPSIYDTDALALHAKNKGKLRVTSKVSLETRDDLSLAYTP